MKNPMQKGSRFIQLDFDMLISHKKYTNYKECVWVRGTKEYSSNM